MATVMSQGEDLLVVREQGSDLPNLTNQGTFAPKNVIVVAQMQGEPAVNFAARVLARAKRELASGRLLRAAVVSIGANLAASAARARHEMLVAIGELLAVRPDAEMQILAPKTVGVHEQAGLFEAIESVLHIAPHLNVRLAFASAATAATGNRRPRKASRVSSQTAAA